MTYVVLARKWRPQRFEDLVGQEAIARTLVNAIRTERVSHAILLTGARGVGKTTTARIFSKALNCEKGMSPVPCGECSNCREIAAGNNVDVLEIDGASNTHVEDVRELLDNVRYTPQKSRHKIYIIDEVHMLSKSAFNALLKTLEEPPSGVIFLFATTEPHKIPETILSRCQRFDFLQISEEATARHLRKVADAEEIRVGAASLSLIARHAGGSLRDAFSALDRILAFTGPDISQDDVVSVLGLADRALLARTLKSFVDQDAKEALAVLDDVWARGFDPKSYLTEIWGRVRDLLVLKCGGGEQLVRGTDEEISQLGQWANGLEEAEIDRWFELLRRTASDLGRTEYPRYLLEVTFLRVTRKQPRIPFGELTERLEALESRLAGGSVRPRSAGAAATPGNPPEKGNQPAPAALPPDWESLVNVVKRKKPAMAAVLLQAAGHELDGGKIVLHYDAGSFLVARAKEKDFTDQLAQAAQGVFGGTFAVEVKTRERAEKVEAPPASVDRVREREALENPTIRKALSIFDARVEEIKPAK